MPCPDHYVDYFILKGGLNVFFILGIIIFAFTLSTAYASQTIFIRVGDSGGTNQFLFQDQIQIDYNQTATLSYWFSARRGPTTWSSMRVDYHEIRPTMITPVQVQFYLGPAYLTNMHNIEIHWYRSGTRLLPNQTTRINWNRSVDLPWNPYSTVVITQFISVGEWSGNYSSVALRYICFEVLPSGFMQEDVATYSSPLNNSENKQTLLITLSIPDNFHVVDDFYTKNVMVKTFAKGKEFVSIIYTSKELVLIDDVKIAFNDGEFKLLTGKTFDGSEVYVIKLDIQEIPVHIISTSDIVTTLGFFDYNVETKDSVIRALEYLSKTDN